MEQPPPSDDWGDLLRELGITKLAHEIKKEDVEGKRLDSISRWQMFYESYARLMGFSVRKDKLRKDAQGNEWQRMWVCSREGFRQDKWINLENRQRDPKALTRTGCEACFRVTKDRAVSTWRASRMEVAHNHELVSLSEVQFLRSHRKSPDCVVADAETISRGPMKTCDILDCIALETVGRSRVPFLKDLCNRLQSRSSEVGQETDTEGVLGYLTCLAIRDGQFFCRFTVDCENRLENLFWADGCSRQDYSTFGDVLAFDTTCRTNAYNKPLLILVGVNHHYKTTVFGLALLSNETTEAYEWVLEQFLCCMNNVAPKVVITDGNHTMRRAISQVLPDAVHRLCARHLESNADSNIPFAEFKLEFSKLIYDHHTESEFEQKWKSLIKSLNLEDNEWAKAVYEERRSWAETFLRGNFFGGMRSTQRCQSIYSCMKRFVESKHLWRDFVSQIDVTVAGIRHTQMQDDFTSKHTDRQIPPNDVLRPYYCQMAKLYTHGLYKLVATELEAHHAFSVTGTEHTANCQTFTLGKFLDGAVPYKVKFFPEEYKLACSCLLFETEGIPCRHAFTVMKFLNLPTIPPCLLMQRWEKNAGQKYTFTAENATVAPPNVLESTRLATLTSEFNALGFYASKFEDTYAEAKQELAKLAERFRDTLHVRGGPENASTWRSDEDTAASNSIINDRRGIKMKVRERDRARPKGLGQDTSQPGARKLKRCKLCLEMGHNMATCTTRKGNTGTPSSAHSIPSAMSTISSHHFTQPTSYTSTQATSQPD